MIRLSRIHFPVTTLGPGNRVGIWFQGCSIRCRGCISVDTWPDSGRAVSLNEIFSLLEQWPADGVTISGGEPFDQPEALLALLRVLRARQPEWDVLVYSGYAYERLALSPCLEFMDALISEPFELDEAHTLPLRGSDNQRLHLLTERGRTRFASYERLRNRSDDALDLMTDRNGTVWLAGIPGRGHLNTLKRLLEARGTVVATTEGKS